ncbi:TolC family protein [uncultured Paraglaciecola sp.]|uniref:TolC family protein n=1 Tax=uncultured Paraglaciecola sp. TaxID=1765024 RepID=UPI002592A3D6|nr:TolC family protein [uncultured Paraglaciecola sp.]
MRNIFSTLATAHLGKSINSSLRANITAYMVLGLLSFEATSQSITATGTPLSLSDTIKIALQNDDWLLKSQSIEKGLYALSEGADALPDPVISLRVLNLPSNGFAFNQEEMTQLQLAASQQLPRGDTLKLKQEKYKTVAEEQPLLRFDRMAKIALRAEELWLDAYKAQTSYQLVEDTRPLIQKLEEIVSTSYASSVGSAGQQDIIRAQLEIMRLRDRLIELKTQKVVSLKKLSQYLFNSRTSGVTDYIPSSDIQLPSKLNDISYIDKKRISLFDTQSNQELIQLVSMHPLVRAKAQQVKGFEFDTKIAKQSLKPQYAVNASYSFRDDTPQGTSRANFYSVGISMSMPLFSSTKQDAEISSRVQTTEAVKTEKLLLIREFLATVNSAYADYKGLCERINIYETGIIPQIKQQTQASLNAYTNDAGNFAEVVRAQVSELDAQLTLLGLEVAKHKAIATLRYYLPLEAQTYE